MSLIQNVSLFCNIASFLFEREFYYGPITFAGGLQPSMVMTRGGTNRRSLCRVRAGLGTEAEIRIGYGSGLPDAGWINSSKIFSALFKGISRVVAVDRQQFLEPLHHEGCAHKENGTGNIELTIGI